MGDTAELSRVLPSYLIGEELGRGGFGQVYAGRHRTLDRAVAIKVLAPWYADLPDVRARFVLEAQVLARLDHPHVVRVYDYVEEGDVCALVMEHLGGGTLRTAGAIMDPARACAVGMAMCAALEHAHRNGVTHRDVKPANVMFAADGVLKLTDFGLAKMLSGDSAQSLLGLIGTPAYMSPEQPAGVGVGPPADIYAAGLVVYELLAGRLPFPIDREPMQVAAMRMLNDPRPLLEVAPQVPGELASAVMRALVREPDGRHPSAEAFGIALARAAAGAWGPTWTEPLTAQVGDLGSIYDAARRAGVVDPPEQARTPTHERIVDEDVRFSVYRPRSVVPERWYDLLAFAHKSDPIEDPDGRVIDPVQEVRAEAARHLGPSRADYRAAEAEAELPLVPGSQLVFVPTAGGLEFDPPQRAFVWDEPVHKEVFRFRADRALEGERAEGRLSVYLGALLIGEVGLSIPVGAGSSTAEVEQQSGPAFRRIFASYSLSDLDVVRQVASYAELFGDSFVHEAAELRTSGAWDDRLAGLIRDADVFQLFWSSRAMHEPSLRREWTYALSLQRAGFVRPVYWEEPFPAQADADLPPAALSAQSFQRLPVHLAAVVAAPVVTASVAETVVPPSVPPRADVLTTAAPTATWSAPPPPAAPATPAPDAEPWSPAPLAAPGGAPEVGPQAPWAPPPPPAPSRRGPGRLATAVGGVLALIVVVAVGVAALNRSHQPGAPTSAAPSTAAPAGGGLATSTTDVGSPVTQPLGSGPEQGSPPEPGGAQTVDAILPPKVDPTTCQAGEAPFAGATDVDEQLTCPTLPNLAGSRLLAVTFTSSAALAANLATFNTDIGFDPSTTTGACAPVAGAGGRQPWSQSGTTPAAGQVVECSTPDTGSLAGRPVFVWTFPGSDAFCILQGDPGSDLAQLGAWWTRNVVDV